MQCHDQTFSKRCIDSYFFNDFKVNLEIIFNLSD